MGAKLIQQLCTRLDRMQDELAEIKACVKRIADAATKPPMDELSERVQQTAKERIQGRAMERAAKKLND